MAFHAVQGNVSLSVTDVLDKRLVFAQAGAHLVEIRNMEVTAQAYFTRFRLEFAKNQAQESRLAGAIRSHDADAVTTADFGREIANERAPVIGIAHVLEARNEAPRTVGLRNLHVHIARTGAAGRAFFAHLDEGADSPLVARTASLDALADPDFFFSQLLIEKRIRLFFFGKRLVPELHELVVREIPTAHTATVKLENASRNTADKRTVMAHEHHRAIQSRHNPFQPLDGGNVEMVRRFVEQK